MNDTLKILVGILLSLLILLAGSGLAWAVAMSISATYPNDKYECPSGAQRWGRIDGGRIHYACFQLNDQKGGP